MSAVPHSMLKPVMLMKLGVLFFISAVFLLPLYILLKNSLSTQAEITSPRSIFFPHHLQWSNFVNLFSDPLFPFAHSLLNSLIISICTTSGVIFISFIAGFAFARNKSRLSSILWKITLGSLLLPATISFIPSYILITTLGWLNSLHGIIIPSLFQAFTVYLYRQFFLNFPRDIEEAAYLDGITLWSLLWKIILPNAIPLSASLAILVFLESWNAFLWPFIVASDPQSWTVQLSLSTFLGSQSSNYPELFAGTVISIIPTMLIFFGLSRYMIRGIQLENEIQ